MSQTVPQMYRSVLRQFVQNSIHPRAKRSPTISSHLRGLFEAGRTVKAGSAAAVNLARDAENMVTYLKSHRLHKALVERYNPTNTLSGEERARMSAGMVGLNMPQAFDADTAPTMEGLRAKQIKGSLKTMFAGKE